MDAFKKIGTTDDVLPGPAKIFEIDGSSIAVWNVEGRYYAYRNVCPHRGGPVGEGEVEGRVVTCPWHGWSYDITTGISLVQSTTRLVPCELKVEGNDLLILLE
jgi:nitrite reductase (NADH) small subunit